jgi:hypothetical protein
MMREGGWILLDGVDAAPHEVERLMALFEEHPSLSIFEGVHPIIFHSPHSLTTEKENIIIGDKESEFRAEYVQISEKFQIFITYQNHQKISPALRSRCFCVYLDTPHQMETLFELSQNILSHSTYTSLYSKSLSKVLTSIFWKIQNQNNSLNFLFSKDSFSPHRIINCAKGLGNDTLTSKSIAEGIIMSFTNCFKKEKDKNYILQDSIQIIQQISKEHQQSDQSSWDELVLQAGRLEYAAIVLKYGNKPSDKEIDSILTVLYMRFYGGKSRIAEFKTITIPLKFSEILPQFENGLLNWYDSMTFDEIPKTISLLKEVVFLVTAFHNLSHPEIINIFPIIIFVDALDEASPLGYLEHTQGQKISQKTITTESFTDFLNQKSSDKDKIKWARIVANTQNIRINFKKLPQKINFKSIFSSLFSNIINIYYNKETPISHESQSILPLLTFPGLRRFLCHFHIQCENKLFTNIVYLLSQNKKLPIQIIHENKSLPQDDSSTLYITINKQFGPLLHFNNSSYIASVEKVQLIFSIEEPLTQPWEIIDCSLTNSNISIEKTLQSCNEIKEPEQILWILSNYFSTIPVEYITPNKFLSELILAIRNYSLYAIKKGLNTNELSLTILGSDNCKNIFKIIEYLEKYDKLDNNDKIDRFIQKENSDELSLTLSNLENEILVIQNIFKNVDILLWTKSLTLIRKIQLKIENMDKEK